MLISFSFLSQGKMYVQFNCRKNQKIRSFVQKSFITWTSKCHWILIKNCKYYQTNRPTPVFKGRNTIIWRALYLYTIKRHGTTPSDTIQLCYMLILYVDVRGTPKPHYCLLLILVTWLKNDTRPHMHSIQKEN